MRFWLITEPARGTSVQVNVSEGADPDKALLAFAREHYAEEMLGYDASHERLVDYLSEATSDDIVLIHVTRVIATEDE